MKKTEIINQISKQAKCKDKKLVKDIIDSYVEIIKTEALTGNSFNIPGFGTFQIVVREEKVTNSMFTNGKDIVIPKRSALRFKVSGLFKKALMSSNKKEK